MNNTAIALASTMNMRLGQRKRRHRRAGPSGFQGDLADGKAIIAGKVEDISLGGFKLVNVADSFEANKHTYIAILSRGGKHYRLLAKPCWTRRGNLSGQQEIGFKILDAPWEWVEYAIQATGDLAYKEDLALQTWH